jgi:N-acyl-D-amino-acid deacylase
MSEQSLNYYIEFMNKIAVLLFVLTLVSCKKEKFDIIIRQATVFDGSGQPSIKTDVGVRGDTIAAVGDLSKAEASEIMDANNLSLAPGFIDTHSHHDRGLNKNPDALAVVSQGVTTIIVGQDGGSSIPLKDYFKSLQDSAVAVNVGSYSGHNSIRDQIMGNDFKRKSTSSEIDRMKILLKADMEAGALGLSTGLEYDPGIYSQKEEVLSLAKILPEYRGRYISHLRSEDRYFWDAVNEIITIGRETKVPVQISHFKLAMRGLWGKADSTINILEAARREGINITADIYPYTYWSSTIRVLFPERNFKDEKEAAFILKEVTSAEGIIFSNYEPNPEYNGKSLADVAKLMKQTPEKTLIELIKKLDECDKQKGDCSGSIVATSMEEKDVAQLMQWSYTNICSDGASSGRHPRGFGAFTRVLGYYVREKNILSMEQAVYKMTSLAAVNLGIKKRGLIKPGYFADLVLFNPQTVNDNATIQNPQAVSTGIEKVWVNGVPVFADGKTTQKHPGRVIQRE